MDYEKISFQIIANAGEAMSSFKEALVYARKGDFENVEHKIIEAQSFIRHAHDAHTSIITSEAQGIKTSYSFLLSHAQDIMMNALLFEDITMEFIEIYKERRI